MTAEEQLTRMLGLPAWLEDSMGDPFPRPTVWAVWRAARVVAGLRAAGLAVGDVDVDCAGGVGVYCDGPLRPGVDAHFELTNTGGCLLITVDRCEAGLVKVVRAADAAEETELIVGLIGAAARKGDL